MGVQNVVRSKFPTEAIRFYRANGRRFLSSDGHFGRSGFYAAARSEIGDWAVKIEPLRSDPRKQLSRTGSTWTPHRRMGEIRDQAMGCRADQGIEDNRSPSKR